MKYGQAAIATDMDFARMSRQPPRKNSRRSSARTAALQGNGYCFLPKSEKLPELPSRHFETRFSSLLPPAAAK
ncbi:protein V57 [Gallid alphaherpesvirus 1]|uniref:Protein V57 n=1 Tax=Infectious laryngotracheitis virus TaxID=10386 RepID=G8HKN9_ILTV|nr:protein V57 [Gallid alphaherpesvirus 1]AER28087.1 protein V57 [Gallid alphaherpesvirus 1]AER28166.1 protein V57 [Gallid alphaherpesvirus 1]AFN02043.1 protein V57 [Gallid alphaherpesvirus 1]ATG31328.1 protein V57 [Gallid alphaherpesvirus 1]ATG31562.1 protein V57 [Gallid alphaherpesvirus 1]